MKNITELSIISTIIFTLSAANLFAAPALVSEGFGQPVANPQQFVIILCNRGTEVALRSVPIKISNADRKVNVFSDPAIKPGECEFSYIRYSKLGMLAGKTYSVTVDVDSKQAIYSITVPPQATPTAITPVSVILDMGNKVKNVATEKQNQQAIVSPSLNSSQYSAQLINSLSSLLEQLSKVLKNR